MFTHLQTSPSEDNRAKDDMIWEEIPKEIELDDENNIDPFEDVDKLDCISEEVN